MSLKRDDKQGHAKEARHDLKNYLDTIIQTSHDGILVVDSEGRFEFGNEAFFRIFGWPEEELLGHNFIKVVPPDLHEFILERWEEVQAGKGAPYEVDIVQKNSARRSLLVSHRHMTITGQRKYCVIAKDVTERKQAEEALRFLGLITEQVSDSVLATNLDFEITYINQSFEHLFGYSQEEILGQSPGMLNADPNAEQIQSDIYKTVSSGGTWRGELLNRRKDGSTFQCDVTIFPLVDDAGNIFAYAGNHRDITERKQAEKALRQKAMRESLILQSLPMAFYVGQPFGEYGGTWVSDQINEICGFTAEQFDADSGLWASRLHPEDRERALAVFDSLIEKEAVEVEYRWQVADGQYLWFLDQAVLMRDENGNPKEVIGTWLDITERKRAEEALTRYHALLEEMVQTRTRELTEAQTTLRKVHRRLLNVSEGERRHLAAELHDSVGQKMVAMSLGIRQTIMGCEDSAGHEAELQALQNVGQQCTETIQEIRTICYGLYPPLLELTGLAPALRQLGQSCEPAVSFHLQCDDSLTEARLHPEQEIALFRMAQEAVSNVLKHSEATNISISLERQADILTMAIRDDGIGFDTTSQLGQGLGLRSMTERALAVGGTIAITSQPGRTSIEVNLPVKPSKTPNA